MAAVRVERPAAAAWPDDEARAFGAAFARAYLTISPRDPGAQTQALAGFVSPELAGATENWRPNDKHEPVTAERVAAPAATDPARIVELREELRERAAAQRWRDQQARRAGRELYSPEQIAHALALVAARRSARRTRR